MCVALNIFKSIASCRPHHSSVQSMNKNMTKNKQQNSLKLCEKKTNGDKTYFCDIKKITKNKRTVTTKKTHTSQDTKPHTNNTAETHKYKTNKNNSAQTKTNKQTSTKTATRETHTTEQTNHK